MNTKLLFFFLFILPAYAFAQPDSSKIFIRFTGGYADQGSSNGVASLGAVLSKNTLYNVGLQTGISLGKHWEAGIGVGYEKQKTDTKAVIEIKRRKNVGITPIDWDNFWRDYEFQTAEQYTSTDIGLITGRVYIAGYWRLFGRLYFNPCMSATYGKATGKQKNQYIFAALHSETYDDLTYFEENEDISYEYFATEISPGFTFFFNRHIAIYLETGCFQFSVTDWEWDNRQWLASIKPAYWNAGLMVAF